MFPLLQVEETAQGISSFLFGNPWILVLAVLFIIGTALILFFLKKIVINSVLGIAAWLILHFVFGIQLTWWISLIIAVVFGLAGIGVLLVLTFLGIQI